MKQFVFALSSLKFIDKCVCLFTRELIVSLVIIHNSYQGDIVSAAGGNYSTLAVTGGVVAIHIQWICNLDFDFQKNCLPR